MITTQTPLLVLFNMLLIFIIYIDMRTALFYPYSVSKRNRRIGIFMIFFFSLFSFWGADWFHYLEEFTNLKAYAPKTGLEEVYIWIIQNLCSNYILFRTIVWGMATFFFILTIHRLSISKDLALFFFGCIWLIWFSYARVSLAMSMLFFGMALLYKPYSNTTLSRIIGIASILCSTFFHKSATFGVAVAIIAVLLKTFNRHTLILILLIFPVMVYLAKNYLGEFMLHDFEGGTDEMQTALSAGQSYLEKSTTTHGPSTLIQMFFERVPYYMLAYMCYKIHLCPVYKSVPQDIRIFLKLTFLLVTFSTVFAFDIGMNTSVIYGRFIRFTAIPATIVLTYLYQNRIFPKFTHWTYITALGGTIYTLIYTIYNSAVANR